jgi:hypothetical protein
LLVVVVVVVVDTTLKMAASVFFRNVGNITDNHVVVSLKVVISALLMVVDSGCSHFLQVQ